MKAQASVKVALVTGGAKGVGAAISVALADAGYAVAVLGRDAQSLEQLKSLLEKRTTKVWVGACDLRDESAIEVQLAQLQEHFPSIDVLVNNAGSVESAPFSRTDAAQWERAMQLNARAPALLCARLVPRMQERGFGRVINIGSLVSLEGARYVSAYAASKHALLGWARSLAKELQGSGVTVNSLCPGYILSPMFERARDALLEKFNGESGKAQEAILQSAGQSRLLSAEEVARWVCWLAEDSGSLNGEAIRLCP